MDFRVAGKRYGRTAVCVINGAPNTQWESFAKTYGHDAFHPVQADTNFATSLVEDTIAFGLRDYMNGSMLKASRPMGGRGGDNKPTVPMNSITNGIAGNTRGEVQEKIYPLGINMGEGAIQVAGSGRTFNIRQQEFAPGDLWYAKVDEKSAPGDKFAGNCYLVPTKFDPKDAKNPLLDRGRTHRALKDLMYTEGLPHDAFPIFDGPPQTLGDPTVVKDFENTTQRVVKELVGRILAGHLAPARNDTYHEIKTTAKNVIDYVKTGKSVEINGADVVTLMYLNDAFKNLFDAYQSEVTGQSIKGSKRYIEPMERQIMDDIDRKNEVGRALMGVVVAPVTAETPLIPFNFLQYSR